MATATAIGFQQLLAASRPERGYPYDQAAIKYFETRCRFFSPAAQVSSVVAKPCPTRIVAYGPYRSGARMAGLANLPGLIDEVLGKGTWQSLQRVTMQIPE